jgi:hypothetical protein
VWDPHRRNPSGPTPAVSHLGALLAGGPGHPFDPTRAPLSPRLACACEWGKGSPYKFGIFNYLPSLQMAPLRLPFLRMHLHICHPSTHEATDLPFLMTWHGSETGKDPNAPALAVHSHLSYHLHVGPTGRSSSTSGREHLQTPSGNHRA